MSSARPFRLVHPVSGIGQTFYACRYPSKGAKMSPDDLAVLRTLGKLP
jgi:hypothetical protein